MPGLFTPPPAGGRSGSSADVFAPVPRFATASETTGRQMIDSAAHGARKRTRESGGLNHTFAPSHTSAVDHSLNFSRFSDAKSPPPLANERYQLAGGMERPDIFVRQNNDYDDYFQLEKQRRMWASPTSPPAGIPHQLSSIDVPEVTLNGSKPWVLNSILSLVGGVAGKLVQFCAVPFRGFQAGGGQAYTFNPQGEPEKASIQEDPFVVHAPAAVQHILPGNYPEDDYGVMSIESLEHERPRMPKRLRTGESWVVVDQDGEVDSRPGTPRLSERRVPQHTRSPSQIPRPVSRANSSCGTPKRPSLIPVSRRSTMDRKSFYGSSATPLKTQTRPRAYSRQSYGSPTMFQNTNENNKTSPLPAESQRLINKMRREELEDEARMRRMSSQMTAMLREAKEALGSKIEIEDEYTDSSGNAMDDHDYSQGMSWYQR
ncbi:hypothetical protein BDV96DRAFT_648381 [Lophiotrema nucula]|uniref:Uncharacterized protein n=1 Tax=Lophiotrema nucula TaxID=690887 RepID=A0A6A5Z536_9PLEO|nr:hypothetical protein BDV96DRAFT_648381 [Lophiotrema nucula]